MVAIKNGVKALFMRMRNNSLLYDNLTTFSIPHVPAIFLATQQLSADAIINLLIRLAGLYSDIISPAPILSFVTIIIFVALVLFPLLSLFFHLAR